MKKIKLIIGVIACLFLATSCTNSPTPVGTYRVNNNTYIIKSDGTATVTDRNGTHTYNTYWEYLSGGGDIRIREDRETSWTMGWDYIDFGDGKIYWDYADYRSHNNGVTYTKTNY